MEVSQWQVPAGREKRGSKRVGLGRKLKSKEQTLKRQRSTSKGSVGELQKESDF